MGGDSEIRLLIAEDDLLVREGTRSVLEQPGDFVVLGTASEPDRLWELLEEHHPDAVVLDIRMPPTHTTEGIDLALRIRREHPHIGVLVLSQHDDPEYALELLGEGSARTAYLLKERLGDPDRLVQAVREVVSGGSVLDPRIVDSLLEAQRRRRVSRLAGLTERELEVLAAMASGKGNAAIAQQLFISERSVEKHTNSIFHKLGLQDAGDINKRVAAVLFFLQRGS